MAIPPTGEPFGGGLAGPGGPGRRVRDMFSGGQRPMITVDPKAISAIDAVKRAVSSLKTEMKSLADQAERYARAMGAAGGGGLGGGMGNFRTGGRPSNMPPIMRPGVAQPTGPPGFTAPTIGAGGRGGKGDGGHEGGLSWREEFIVGGYARDLGRMLLNTVGDVVQRERVTSRLAMNAPGAYTGYGQAQAWQTQLRSAGGYTSTRDLYQGAGVLGQAGLMRDITRGERTGTRQLIQDTGLVSRITGTNYTTAAQIEAGFRDPNVVNSLRQGMVGGRSITSPFAGGGLQLFSQKGQGPGLLEQIYGGLGGNRRGEQFYNTGLAPGGGLARIQTQTGMSDDQMKLIQAYGVARAERATAHPEETEAQQAAAVQKDLQKRFKDTGQDLQELQAAWSDMKDLIVTGLVPLIKALNAGLRPLVGTVDWLNKTIPHAQQVFGALIGALIAWQIKVRLASAFTGGGMAGKALGAFGGTRLGTGMGGAAGLGGALAAGAGYATAGMIGGEMLQSGIGGEHGTARSRIGGALGGAARGAGVGAAVGGVLGAGVLSWASAPLGAAVGGVLGGIWGGARGDAWPEWMREGVGDAAEVPQGGPASGKDLRGAKSSDTNMNPEFAKKLQAMFAENPRLSLTSGWRDPATQARLYKEKPNLAAPPGKSNHEKGTAADIGPPSEYAWIAANLGKYGLTLPMPNTAERKAKGKKIEPWHVEPAGGMAAAATSGTPVTAATPTAPTKTKAATKAVSPEVRSSTSVQGGAGAYNEASAAAAILGGTQIGDNWEGDNTVVFPYTTGGGVQTGSGRAGSITIGRIEINLTIARGTPEEAERTARYLGSLLGDRERMLALARGGTP